MKRYDSYKDSGVKWLGEIPSHWEMRKMKFSFEEKSDKGYPTLPLLAATQNHGVIMKDDYENRTVEATKSLDSLKKVEKGDFVISLRSFQGGIELSYCRGIISPAYTVLRPTHIKGCYFKYLGKSPIFIQLLKSMVTGIREGQNIDYAKLRENQLPIPSLKEQNAIASYLDVATSKIDEAIAQQQKMIDLLNERKQIIINNAVTKGLNPNAPMKDSGIDWIGQIPSHWETIRMGYCSWIRARLGWKGLKANEYVDNGYAFLSAFNIQNNQLVWEPLNYITKYRYDESPEIKLRVGDILLVKDGAGIGKCARVDSLPMGEATANGSLAFISPDERIHYRFLYYFIISNCFNKYTELLINGMGVPHFTQGEMKKVKVPLPPIEEQISISDSLDNEIDNINKAIVHYQNQISLLQERKHIIINDVVTGKVKVV